MPRGNCNRYGVATPDYSRWLRVIRGWKPHGSGSGHGEAAFFPRIARVERGRQEQSVGAPRTGAQILLAPPTYPCEKLREGSSPRLPPPPRGRLCKSKAKSKATAKSNPAFHVERF